MIRILCIEAYIGAAANIGGPVHTSGKTFDLHAPHVEAWLAEKNEWVHRSVVAVEIKPEEKTP